MNNSWLSNQIPPPTAPMAHRSGFIPFLIIFALATLAFVALI